MKISVIVPCYNEMSVIKKTFEKLSAVLEKDRTVHHYDFEIIFVDDGSSDNTLEVMRNLAESNGCVKYISFSRNFGKEAGMLAGLSYSAGDAVVLIDADLQHPPELIPDMIGYYIEGYNQVIARRNRVGDSRARSFLSRFYYKIVNHMIDVKLSDGVGDFRLLSRKAVNAVLSMKEYNRFSKGLFSWIGFDEKIIEYENQSRASGESKWSFAKLVQYGIDGILSFNDKPLRSVMYTGFILVLLGILYIIYSLIRVMVVGIEMPGYFTLITAVLVMGGVQLISTGVIGEYVGRIYYEVKHRPHFIINETNIESDQLHPSSEESHGEQN